MGAVLPVVALLALPLAGTSAAATSCAQVRADREVAPIEAYDPRPGAARVFAMQPKQDVRNVVTYASFRRKIDCMLRQIVVPRMARNRPDVVVFTRTSA